VIVESDALDVWLRLIDGADESDAEANTFRVDGGFRVDWSLTDVGLVRSRWFPTYREARAWLRAEGFQDFTS
jgi:hypothetical protein